MTEAAKDQTLVERMNAGDARAFDDLYARYRDWTVRLAYRFTGDEDAALDVLQETFMYLFSKFPGFELRARFTTFLYPVVKNVAIRLREKGKRFAGNTAALDAIAADPDGAADPGSERADLAAAMATLADAHREVVLLRFVDGLSLAEIAEAVAVPVGTVKSRLHKALRALREDARAKRYFIEA